MYGLTCIDRSACYNEALCHGKTKAALLRRLPGFRNRGKTKNLEKRSLELAR